jgi:hypothetical protein
LSKWHAGTEFFISKKNAEIRWPCKMHMASSVYQNQGSSTSWPQGLGPYMWAVVLPLLWVGSELGPIWSEHEAIRSIHIEVDLTPDNLWFALTNIPDFPIC